MAWGEGKFRAWKQPSHSPKSLIPQPLQDFPLHFWRFLLLALLPVGGCSLAECLNVNRDYPRLGQCWPSLQSARSTSLERWVGDG